MMKRIKEFLLVNLGLFLVAAGIHFFKSPNGFVTGGVSGLAILISTASPAFTVGPAMLMLNIVLLIYGFLSIGWNFGYRTVYSSFALSGMVLLLEQIAPLIKPMTDDLMLELIFSIALPAIGTAIVFNQNSSTGGTDIVAKVLSEKTSMDIGKALLFADVFIALGAFPLFGTKIGLYCMLGLFLKGFMIDSVIEGINLRKQLVIISEKHVEISAFINLSLGRGATIHDAEGAFTHEKKRVITAIMTRRQAVQVRRFIRELDPKAFITITNTSETIGKGFRSFV